jgi:LysM repeat protein
VDDSAWAIGLKKAGYATASDYAFKLMKVMDDYELSQFNFPELNDENDTAETETTTVTEKPMVVAKEVVAKNTSLDKKETGSNSSMEAPKETVLRIPVNKDTTIAVNKDTTIQVKTVKDSASNYINQASLPINNIKGIESSKTIATVTEIKMNSIGNDTTIVTKPKTNAAVTEIKMSSNGKDTAIAKKTNTPVKDTISKKPSSIYPDKPFKINQVSVIWAKAGTSLLQIATENNIPLYKVFVFNDLKETDLLAQDQLLFLANKKAEADKSFHLVVTGESLYDISQKEGIQLKKLKEYNPGISDNPAAGTQLILVKPKEQKPKLSLKK